MKYLLKSLFVVLLISASFIGCTTTATNELSGASGGVGSYDARESGRHWVRPQEVTYEIGDPLEYSTTIDLLDAGMQETVVFGYPQPGQQANPFVSKALAEAVFEHDVDGFFLTTYDIVRTTGAVDTNTADVTIVGRPLKMVSLGEVSAERADQERFITVVEEEAQQDGSTVIRSTTRPKEEVELFTETPKGESADSDQESSGRGWFLLGVPAVGLLLLAIVGL